MTANAQVITEHQDPPIAYTYQLSPTTLYTPITASLDPNKALILKMVSDAGFSPITANKVITCESGWNPEAHNWRDPHGGSHGLWQLNGVHGLTMEEMTDPIKSTEYAIKLLKSSRSWNHWSCYTK